ncbi:MAG: hypothetical protein ACRDHN_19250, partial [Thermomicrobiales bacterium]
MTNRRFFDLLVSASFFAAFGSRVEAFDLMEGDLYSSNFQSSAISQYSSDGVFIDSIAIDPSYGSEVRGLAFGPDNLLYAATVAGNGFNVISIDALGTIQHTYNGQSYLAGNLSAGKIAFARNGQFFVAGGGNLVRFDIGTTYGSYIYSNNQVYGVEGLPSGNLLVLSAYQLDEITTEGAIVRTITPSPIRFVDARDVEYDPASDAIYVSMLGYSGEEFQVMRLNGASGQLLQ